MQTKKKKIRRRQTKELERLHKEMLRDQKDQANMLALKHHFYTLESSSRQDTTDQKAFFEKKYDGKYPYTILSMISELS